VVFSDGHPVSAEKANHFQNGPLAWNPVNLGKRSKSNSVAVLHVFVWWWTKQTFC